MKKFGFILVIIGILIFILYFMYKGIINKKCQDDINDYINKTSQIIEKKEEIVEEPLNEKKESIININYIAIIEIPKINLKKGLVNKNSDENNINQNIQILKESSMPDVENGNLILAAHSGNSSVAFFNKLYQLDNDDDIYVYYNGIKYDYKIIKKYDIKKTGKAKIISSKGDRLVTLITCNPNRDGYQTVVIGKQVSKINY